jgi:Family of unknown function (DUF5319)
MDGHDHPTDPFDGGPDDPTAELAEAFARLDAEQGDDDEEPVPPLTPAERTELLSDLEDLDIFRTLLEPRGTLGLVVDCADCNEPHYFSWDLLQANLRHLLDLGTPRVHEPAFAPDPDDYVPWDYARGYADGVLEALESMPGDDGQG